MAQPGKLLKEQKYDRQLRLWGDHGQEALESAHRSSIGKNRAQAAMEFLQELNNDVSGSFVEESPENLLDNDPSFFCRFTIVVATQLPESTLLNLADVLWNSQIPLLICRTYGLVGYMRIIIKEHPGHVCLSQDHSHTPWIVIIAKYLAQWYSETNGRIPKTYKEKEDFRDLIRQ
ncbi:NEDD8-activating enzyme E1 regulatory subunit, partial [Eschrichtius robustus]|nr:NEDD8-activating enzyme E1 regulatory subunit [Eschrichtius robustus]